MKILDKDIIAFELGAFNPKNGTFYILEDGLHRLQYLIHKGNKDILRRLSKAEKKSTWIQQLIIEQKILEYVISHADSVICLDMKVSSKYLRLMKEFDKLNKESQK